MTQFILSVMSPKEITNIDIQHETFDTPYGKVVIASTRTGICYIAFGDEKRMLHELHQRYPTANLIHQQTDWHAKALLLINGKETSETLPLHVYGTDFQLHVWSELLKIPVSHTTTYKAIAESIGKPKATRAVGTAVGNNPVSYLIPCHRVVRSDGGLGGYHWGIDVKIKMLQAEK